MGRFFVFGLRGNCFGLTIQSTLLFRPLNNQFPAEFLLCAPQKVEDFFLEGGVGCESCHGAGGVHSQAPSMDNIIRLGDSCAECVIETLCTSCHTQEWDPKWILRERLKIYRTEN